jgi:hypothetical protein
LKKNDLFGFGCLSGQPGLKTIDPWIEFRGGLPPFFSLYFRRRFMTATFLRHGMGLLFRYSRRGRMIEHYVANSDKEVVEVARVGVMHRIGCLRGPIRVILKNSERGELVMILVDATLEQPPESRVSYLQSACRGDLVLREEVQKRINWEEKIHSFLRQAVITSLGHVDRSVEAENNWLDGSVSSKK